MTSKFYLLLLALLLPHLTEARTLVGFSKDQKYPHIMTWGTHVTQHEDGAVTIASDGGKEWSSVSFLAGKQPWDLRGFSRVEVEITNTGSSSIRVGVIIGDPNAHSKGTPQLQGYEYFEPGETRTMSMPLRVGGWDFDQEMNLVGMRWAPGQQLVETSAVNHVQVSLNSDFKPRFLKISNIRATGSVTPMKADSFLPFVDAYGQFRHRDWSQKIHRNEDFVTRRKLEDADLAQNPAPADWSQYGGWTAGPKQKATGFFRVEKVDGKWWLVDPEGHLFWSTGPTCISTGFGWTPVSAREEYFEALPNEDSPMAKFYSKGGWAPLGFYQDKVPYTSFRFYEANLFRKYGDDYLKEFSNSAHLRLRSWGMNTIANWASPEVYQEGRTAYVTNIFVRRNKKLQASDGYWNKFHDVFDPSFRQSVRRGLSRLTHEAQDPWCIGFFVDNELSWGNQTDLAFWTLSSPPDQKAKQVFIADLKKKYQDIQRLNLAWGTNHASWEALLQVTWKPNIHRAAEDLQAFTAKTAETYFVTIKEELEKIAPNHLYLGCRFAWKNDYAVHASARHCDVVSYNQYRHSLRTVRLPDYIDRPLIIGEYHFGSTDLGHFHPGIVEAQDQKERGELFKQYIHSGLENPQIVGAHWFQYMDEHIAGRGDGENYNVGLVDMADNPYPEMINAIREVSKTMYSYRLNSSE